MWSWGPRQGMPLAFHWGLHPGPGEPLSVHGEVMRDVSSQGLPALKIWYREKAGEEPSKF